MGKHGNQQDHSKAPKLCTISFKQVTCPVTLGVHTTGLQTLL